MTLARPVESDVPLKGRVGLIFAQHSQEASRQQLAEVVRVMEAQWPEAAEDLAPGEDDGLAYMIFPPEHWRRIYSTNPLEWVNRAVKRTMSVVSIFANAASVLRLVRSVLIDAHDEGPAGRRYLSLESIPKLH